MDNSIRTKWIFLALALVLSCGCKDNANNLPAGAEKKVADFANSEDAQDLTKLPHEAVNDLLLTAEVLDEENWIVGLTWENVGDAPLTLSMAGLLREDIRNAYASPFHPLAYSNRGVTLNRGKHSDITVLDLTRDRDYREEDAHAVLRDLWGLRGSIMDDVYFKYNQDMLLRSGQKITCFFRYPRFKSDDESGHWKEGDRIPIDFSYSVGKEVSGSNRVSLSSGENGEARMHQPPSVWRGKVFSNVVYLPWSSAGERVRWPASPLSTPLPPEPVNDLLLSLDIVDEEKWIVRLTWKNVGKTPIEVPVTEALEEDIIEESRSYKSPPLLCTPGYYTNYRYYGRPFGCRLGWGEQVDQSLLDFNRDGKHASTNDAYEALRALDGKIIVSTHREGGLLSGTKWHHLEPGEEMSVTFWFPRFESDDREKRWVEGDEIPLEFRFEAGEIPNSSPPEREERIGDEIRLRRYPAWQGDVYSNVVFFTWTSGSERVKWKEPVK